MDLQAHYERSWGPASAALENQRKPLPGLRVLVFPLRANRKAWTYATDGMSTAEHALELHLFSPIKSELHVELLTIVAAYHRTGLPLGLGHTVNFGRPWLPGSRCDHGLISLPYLDGPAIEESALVRCYWLIPITEDERAYKKQHGLEAFEQKLEASGFDYLDPARASVV